MICEHNYLRIVRASAWYDLLISWPFAIPITLGIMWQLLGRLQTATGYPPLPTLDVYATLFANFFGTVVTIWSLIRLTCSNVTLGRYDGIARLAFSAWMIVALLHGATPLLLGFLVVEIAFGIAQALPINRRVASVA